MKVLIATNHLAAYTGSEIIALEVAEGFRAAGHTPLLFANAVSEELQKHAADRGLEVRDGELQSPEEFDLVWSQHFVFPLWLRHFQPAAGKERPLFVFAHLSPYEPYESPAPLVEDLFAGVILANSPETRDALVAAGLPARRIRLFPNPAPAVFKCSPPATSTLRRLLVVTNHMPAELKGALAILQAEAGVEVTHLGMEGVHRRVFPEDLREHDAVVAIGKTTQYALLARRPVYCYDLYGGPGWLSTGNFAKAAQFNFSGRCTRRKLPAGEIAAEVLNGFEKAAQFASSLNEGTLERFTLEPYLHSLAAEALRRQTWTEREVRRILRWAPQLSRVRAMAEAVRREVVVQAAARKQNQDYARALERAERLAGDREGELKSYARALAEAERVVGEREAEVRRYAAALTEAQQVVGEREAEVRRYAAALAEAERVVGEREAEVRRYAAALTEAQRVVGEREAEVRRYAAALAEAERVVGEREAEVRRYAAALAGAERVASERRAEAQRYAQRLEGAQSLVEKLSQQLDQMNQALAAAQHTAAERAELLKEKAAQLLDAEARLQRSQADLEALRRTCERTEQRAREWELVCNDREAELQRVMSELLRIRQSLSWRLGAPLRWAGKLLGWEL